VNNIFSAVPSVIATFKKYLGYEIFFIFFLSAAAGVLDGLGIMLVLPLIETIAGSDNQSGVSSYLLKGLGLLGVSPDMINILICMVVVFVLKGIALFISLERVAFFRGKLLLHLKLGLVSNFKEMNLGYYSQKNAGYFTNILNDQVNRSLQSFLSVCQLISHSVNALIYVCLAFIVTWSFGLMACALGVALLYLFRFLNKILAEISLKNSVESGVLTSRVVEFVQGFKYLKATNKFPSVLPNINQSIERLSSYEVSNGRAAAFTQSVREPVAVIFITTIMLVQLVYLEQPVAPIFVSIILFYRGLNSVLQIQGYWQNTLEYSGGLQLVDQEFAALAQNKDYSHSASPVKSFSQIEFDSVCFRYPGASSNALTDISFTILNSESYAIVGRSGSGKSTLADTICLLNEPRSGAIYIDGQDARTVSQDDWRGMIGYVPQFPVVLEGSILENIVLDNEVDMTRVEECIVAAGLSDDVKSFDNGLETSVGERGMSLSGGQRQRLAIARELYSNPKLLILDEATSALDSHSEGAIVDTIQRLKGHVCLIVIAHRLSTVRAVENILVLENGVVVESGQNKELSQLKHSSFRELLVAQELI